MIKKGLTAIIEAAMEEEQERKDSTPYPRGSGVFWPSSSSVSFTNEFGEEEIAGKCMRSEYWSILGEPSTNKTNARSMRIWNYGNNVEDCELKGAKLAGIHRSDGTSFVHELTSGLRVRGRVDGIYEIQGTTVGVEYKSGYGPWFRRNQLGLGYDGRVMKSDPGKPRESNVLQTMLYLDHFKHIKVFVLIYLDRGDGAWREYKVRLDEEGHATIEGAVDDRFTVGDIYKRFEELQVYVDKKEVPPPDFEPFYSDERVEVLRERETLTKKAYELHQKFKNKKRGGKRAGYFLCNGYCPYEKLCKNLILKDEKKLKPLAEQT